VKCIASLDFRKGDKSFPFITSWHIPLVEFCDSQKEERQRCVNANTTAEKGLFFFSNIYPKRCTYYRVYFI
jgi:hypothetical protein